MVSCAVMGVAVGVAVCAHVTRDVNVLNQHYKSSSPLVAWKLKVYTTMASLRRCLAYTSLLLVMVAGVAMVRAEDDGFDLRLRKIIPCQEMDMQYSNVSLFRSDILAVQNNFTYCDGQVLNRTQYSVR